MRAAALLLVLLLVLLTAGVASAQGYAAFDEQPESWRRALTPPGEDDDWTAGPRPDDAVRLDGATTSVVQLPFRMRYFDTDLDALTVSPEGWAVPGEDEDPRADGRAVADIDGVLAVFVTGGFEKAEETWTWTEGVAPQRVFVVDWRFPGGPLHARLCLFEQRGDIVLAYHRAPLVGDAADRGFVARLDEPGGARFVAPAPRGTGTPRNTLFRRREPLYSPPGIGKEGAPVMWQDVRKESTVPDGCFRRCTYLARGRGYLHVPDLARYWWSESGLHKQPPEFTERLLAEDRATFGGAGDITRWVRQVLDGKVLLLPADGGEPVRIWFRIVEYFSLDERGTSLADHHVWNVRWMLSRAFPGDDPRGDIDRYYAWRGTARGRLTVGKLFAAGQTDASAKQYDSGRKNEYVLWSGRLREGTRGTLAPFATPGSGWTRFALMEDDMRVTQHADADDLRFVPDPCYLEGGFEYVIAAPGADHGWITGRGVPRPPLRDEGIDDDPEATTGPVTPR